MCFPEIVNEQTRLEDELFLKANRVLFCDTDLYTTYLWYQIWQAQVAGDSLGSSIHEEAMKRVADYDLVLIMDHHDTEWVDDGLRDQKHSRNWFTDSFQRFYPNYARNVATLSGTWEEREKRACQLVNGLFDAKTTAKKTEATLPYR